MLSLRSNRVKMLEYAPKSEYRHAAFRLVNNFGKIHRLLHYVGPVVINQMQIHLGNGD